MWPGGASGRNGIWLCYGAVSIFKKITFGTWALELSASGISGSLQLLSKCSLCIDAFLVWLLAQSRFDIFQDDNIYLVDMCTDTFAPWNLSKLSVSLLWCLYFHGILWVLFPLLCHWHCGIYSWIYLFIPCDIIIS